jgi:hypothetical protein
VTTPVPVAGGGGPPAIVQRRSGFDDIQAERRLAADTSGNRMHTIMIIVAGMGLLAVILLAGRWLGGVEQAGLVVSAKIFIPVWLIASLVNMWLGVSRAGYTAAEELPILLLVFGIPAAVAGLVIGMPLARRTPL